MSSVYVHSTVAMHYLGGGWYPRGGSIEIAKKMIPTIERTGGRVLVRKGVDKILIENGRAAGAYCFLVSMISMIWFGLA